MKTLLCIITLFIIAAVKADECPQRCKCFSKVNTVDCKKAGLLRIPLTFPKDTKKIDLSMNDITEVADKAFASSPLVTYIDLRHNKIEKLGGFAFSDLSDLKILYLNQNKLKDKTDLTSLSGLTELTELHLSFNQFTKAPPIQSESLQKLVMDGNRIESAAFPDSFKLCSSLQSIVLSNNKISIISSTDFTNLGSTIKNINLNSNLIKEIDPAALNPLSENLETLTLDSNRLNEAGVAEALQGFSGTSAPALLTLSLKRNRITKIDSKLFLALSNGVLRNIQLDFNTIKSLDHTGFTYFRQSLKLLSLINCGLNEFDVDMSQFTSLTQLALDKNHLKSLPDLLPSSLQKLTASSNVISSWPSTTFNDLSSLVDLDLSSNQLQTIDKTLVDSLTSLKHLNLDKNPFKCDCDLKNFIVWALKNSKKIKNWPKYRCVSPNDKRGTTLSKFDISGCSKSKSEL